MRNWARATELDSVMVAEEGIGGIGVDVTGDAKRVDVRAEERADGAGSDVTGGSEGEGSAKDIRVRTGGIGVGASGGQPA